MSTPLRLLPPVLAVVLVGVAACGGSSTSPAPSAAGLQRLQLRSSEVPAGFYLASRTALTSAQTARSQGLDGAIYAAHGGGTSLAERFAEHYSNGLGLTFIYSQLFSFGSASGVAWAFRELRANLARSGTVGTVQETVDVGATPTPLPTFVNLLKHPVAPPPTLYQPERVRPLGDEDAGFTNTSAAYAGEYVFTNQVVLFRRGKYCAVVHIAGNYDQVPLSAALSLAGRIDGRIRSQHA